MKKLIIILSLILFSCKETGKIYYVHNFEEKATYTDSTTSEEIEVPPPPGGPSYYIENNFIIDDNDNVFYYKGKDFRIVQCIHGANHQDIRPKLIELNPERLQKIEKNSIEDFLQDNIKLDELEFVIVASARDSFRSSSLDKIDNVLRSHYNDDRILIRKTTHEEEVVLMHKKTGRHFKSSAYPWDTTRIKMPVPRK